MKKKLSLVLALGLVCSTVLTGCGGGNAETQPQTIAAPTTEAATEAATTEAAQAETEANGAQEMVFVLSNEPDGIDPGVTNNSFASTFLVNCFEGLVTYDATGTVVPGNAESWDISEDGTVYTFHLRDGLKWSDGTDLTAEDYVYALQRVLNPETAGQYVDIVTAYVKNAKEYYAGEATAEELGVKAVDPQTLEITLIQPTSFFIDLLTMWVFDPVQKATIEANGDQWTASPETYVCNGPFKITEMNMGESMVLEKNENYWDAENITMEKVTLRYILDTSTALTAYESGEVDGIRNIPSSDYARLKAENAGIQSVPNYGTVYYDINCEKEPYNNPLVRKALNLAVDRQAIIDNVVQVDATPAYNFLAPGYVVDGTDITEGRSDRGLSPNADPEAAKAALAEAGYPDGEGFPTLQLSYYSDDTVKKVVEAMAEMLETNLGIEVEITSNDWAIFYENVQKGNYEVAAMGWSADYTHPMSFLPLLVTDDANNNSFYSNPEYDAMVEQIKAETDPAKAVELIKQAEDLVMEEYPFINLYYKANNFLMKDYVKGYYMLSNGNLCFKNASISK
ncbi:MAG: peptide ABC transporter substrate-binding protein [Lachnospiraceae bacterium]|jgi:oligopeptide transport system substrate-binding protein